MRLTDETDVTGAVNETIARFGGIGVVVNNAGYGYLAAVEETTDKDVRQMFDVQINGTWNVLRAVLPGFRAARSGHVINISSILGLVCPLFRPGGGWCGAGRYLDRSVLKVRPALTGRTFSTAGFRQEQGRACARAARLRSRGPDAPARV